MFGDLIAATLALSQIASTAIVESSDSSIEYEPSGSWVQSAASNATGGQAMFLVHNSSEGRIDFTFPEPSMVFQFWGYQRSDAGMLSISFDNNDTSTSQIDLYNSSATPTDPPLLLYSTTGLSDAIHTATLKNLLDTRANQYGQMNIDRFVVASGGPPDSDDSGGRAPTFPPDSFLTEVPIIGSYHASLSLGADTTANGGTGKSVNVLLDTGAGGAWVIWSGCTDTVCTDNHNTYSSSSTDFSNSTKQDSLSYGSGGPDNTLGTWRVNDTLTFGNVTLNGATYGAAYLLPSRGENGMDGNFGMAKSYCDGVLCANYVGFLERMYEAGLIKAPVLSLFQVSPEDSPPDGVISMAAIGGIDSNKFTGDMDWIPMMSTSQWISPGTQKYVQGAGEIIDATASFTHTHLTFDTGDPGLLGLPHNDWLTLVDLIGGKLDPAANDNTTYRFPCASSMTFNFHGSQNRNYTFALANATLSDASGFCDPLANDAGDTTNWITGVPFFGHYYTAWYYGEKGVGSTLGLGEKNLGESAKTSAVFVGVA